MTSRDNYDRATMAGMDVRQLRRFLKVYRVARTARSARLGHRKAKRMLDAHSAQNSVLMDAVELVERVAGNEVRSEDVRGGVRVAINSIPRIHRAIARHIQKQKGRADAEA